MLIPKEKLDAIRKNTDKLIEDFRRYYNTDYYRLGGSDTFEKEKASWSTLINHEAANTLLLVARSQDAKIKTIKKLAQIHDKISGTGNQELRDQLRLLNGSIGSKTIRPQ